MKPIFRSLPVLFLLATFVPRLWADNLVVMGSFGSTSLPGGNPGEPLVAATDGNFYGTTPESNGNLGTVFKIVPTKTGFQPSTLYSFDGYDGQMPLGLIQGKDGYLYGVTEYGGPRYYPPTLAQGIGTIFRMTRSGALTTLVGVDNINYSSSPVSILQAADGNYYGMTRFGGIDGYGSVYKLALSSTANTLSSFFGFDSGYNIYPYEYYSGIIQASDHNFYGTIPYGGQTNQGMVFKINPSGTMTVLASFNGLLGEFPEAGVIQGKDGNFYGTTSYGGKNYNPSNTFSGSGTIFKVTPTGTLTALVSLKGPTGINPYSSLIQASDGNFYGTTTGGGQTGQGTVFQYVPGKTSITTIASFEGTDGRDPISPVVEGKDHHLYGTTTLGGTNDVGVAYQTTFIIKGTQVQTITFPAVGTVKLGQSVTLQAKSTSSLPITYSVIPTTGFTGSATISGSTITFTGAGTIRLAADQIGNGVYAAAKEVQINVVVARGTQTLSSFTPVPTQTYGTTLVDLRPPTASSGLPVTVTLVSGPAQVLSSTTVSIKGAGVVTLQASQAGNVNYDAAKSVTTSFVVRKANQTINFPKLLATTIGNTVTLKAAASSGLPVTYSIVSVSGYTGQGTLFSGSKITFTNPGTIRLQASQGGNANYNAAPHVAINVIIEKKTQALTAFAPIANQTLGVPPLTVTLPTASSKLPVTIAVSGPATLSGDKLTITGTGKVTLTATQPGNATYSAAGAVSVSFTVSKGTGG